MKTFLSLVSFTIFFFVCTPVQAQLDSSFGNGGKVVTIIDSVYSNAEFDAMTVFPDGKIIASGWGAGGRLIIKYSDSGVVDSSFGAFGKRIDSFQMNGATSMVVQPDGKILTGGKYLERCLQNGQTDAAFGSNGRVSPLLDINIQIALTGNKIIAGGTYQNEIVLYQYNIDGSPDSSFGINGTVTTNFNGPGAGNYNNIMMRSLLLQPDGKVIVSGESFVTAIQSTAFILVRYNNDGSLDTSFNRTGKAYTYVGGGWAQFGRDAKLQPDGKILQCGAGGLGIALVRYNTDGSLDTTFDHTGICSVNGDLHEAHCVALDLSGNIVTAGITDSNQCSLRRIKTDGSTDSTFGINGRILTLLDTIAVANPYRVNLLHLYNDGRILVGGYIRSEPFLMRYLFKSHPSVIKQPANTIVHQLHVYPNPADESVTIISPPTNGALTIVDIQGHLITQMKVNGQPRVLNLSEYAPGFYLITIKASDGQIFYARFLKK
ncbi:T9SS type A sorting domain-containing protein [Taibaiella soli]|uniref:T9SS type A sorting domain-containing protein n=1 Tax=Taibaiella soli TaxID=1649169 RepID=UPI001402FE7D|nr:T9SS type A sorting domain-containing protein [Taibaiella soli]